MGLLLPASEIRAMRSIPLWIHWIIAASGASVAFRIGGMLEGIPYRNYGDGIFGVRNWLLATMLAGIVGTLFAPVAHRTVARSIFIGIPTCVSAIMLVYYLLNGFQEEVAISSVTQSIVGGFVAWLFLNKIIITF